MGVRGPSVRANARIFEDEYRSVARAFLRNLLQYRRLTGARFAVDLNKSALSQGGFDFQVRGASMELQTMYVGFDVVQRALRF